MAASEMKELNSSRNLEKGTRRLTDGWRRTMNINTDHFVCGSLRVTLDDSNEEKSGRNAVKGSRIRKPVPPKEDEEEMSE